MFPDCIDIQYLAEVLWRRSPATKNCGINSESVMPLSFLLPTKNSHLAGKDSLTLFPSMENMACCENTCGWHLTVHCLHCVSLGKHTASKIQLCSLLYYYCCVGLEAFAVTAVNVGHLTMRSSHYNTDQKKRRVERKTNTKKTCLHVVHSCMHDVLS